MADKKEEAISSMLMHVAKGMPLEVLVESLERDIQTYKKDPEDEMVRRKLHFSCMLVILKDVVEDADGDIKSLQERMKKMDAGVDFLTPKEN